MPRVTEIEEDGGDPTLKAIFDRQREMFGGLLNPTKVMAHCPPILKAAGLGLVLASGAGIIVYLSMRWFPALWWLVAARVVAGITGATFPTAYAYIADVTPPEKRGANFGAAVGNVLVQGICHLDE